MSSPCEKCGRKVYKAEEKRHDGKVFHGLCFAAWKKENDLQLANKRNREYYRRPDVSCTDPRGNLNSIIYYDLGEEGYR